MNNIFDIHVRINETIHKLKEDIFECENKPTKQVINDSIVLFTLLTENIKVKDDIKYGMFIEDSGKISVVLQSLLTDRRINCCVDNNNINTLRLDEDMNSYINTDLCSKDVCTSLYLWVTKSN